MALQAAVNQRLVLESHRKVRLLMTPINQIERQDILAGGRAAEPELVSFSCQREEMLGVD